MGDRGLRILFASLVAAMAQQPLRLAAPELGIAHLGRDIVVEGVLQSRAGEGEATRLKLEKCDALIRIDERLVADARTKDNVEIVGKVRQSADGERIEVVARSLRRLPTDIAVFDIKAKALSDGDGPGWRQLAQWAKRRFELYGDAELAGRARIAVQNAIAAERKAAAGNPGLLEVLRDGLRGDRALEDFDFDGLEHEILRAKFARMTEPKSAVLRDFERSTRDRIALPAQVVVKPVDKAGRARYDADPVGWFLLADSSARQSLLRYWQASLLDAAARLEIRDLADRVNEQIDMLEKHVADLADYPDLAAATIDFASDALLRRLDRFEPAEIARFAALLQNVVGNRGRADRLRESWLQSSLERLKAAESNAADAAKRINAAPPPLDAASRVKLASAWLEWFPNSRTAKASAVRLLTEALQIDPRNDEAETRLRRLGFRPRPDGVWEGNDAASERDAASVSSIKVGEPGDRVRDVLGAPAAQSRLIGKDWISHVWQYEGVTYLLREDARTGRTHVTGIVTGRADKRGSR